MRINSLLKSSLDGPSLVHFLMALERQVNEVLKADSGFDVRPSSRLSVKVGENKILFSQSDDGKEVMANIELEVERPGHKVYLHLAKPSFDALLMKIYEHLDGIVECDLSDNLILKALKEHMGMMSVARKYPMKDLLFVIKHEMLCAGDPYSIGFSGLNNRLNFRLDDAEYIEVSRSNNLKGGQADGIFFSIQPEGGMAEEYLCAFHSLGKLSAETVERWLSGVDIVKNKHANKAWF